MNFDLNIYFHNNIYKGRMTTDNIKQQLQTIMTTTPEEDKQYLNEVKEEIKTKRKPGRPRIYTIEEAKERVRQYDLRRYRENREKNRNG